MGYFVRRALPSLIVLIAISLGSIFFRLGSLPLTGPDEPRYARIAQEMRDQGNWVTPTLEGKPWLEKPPLYYWLTIPFYSVFDSPETAARIAPALCALATALAIFCLGSLVSTRLAAMLAATILLTSLGYAGYGRGASTDMPFTCCFTIAMMVLVVAVEKNIGAKVLFAYLFLGLAILGKGPVAIVLAAGILLCFWLLDERGGILRRWHIIQGIIIAGAVSIPWFWLAFRQNGYSFISTFFINHNFARFVTNIHHHSQPFYYYLPVLLALVFPWSGWLVLLISKSPIAALRRWREWNPLIAFLACWFLTPILFFSLSDSKLAGYILPSLPPLALILGILLNSWIEGTAEPSRLRAAVYLQLVLSAAMAIAAPIFFQKNYGGRWGIGLSLSVAILTPAIITFLFGLKGNVRRAFQATALQGVVMLIAVAQFAFPALGAYHSTRDIAHQALQLRTPGEPIASYRFFHHTLHYYTNYQITDLKDDPIALLKFAHAHPTALIVTKSSSLKALSAIKDITITPLCTQANFHLIRITPK
jgi:4-amino-4-deoxy-L-arabinose transferase-like glycosyltransferase